ALPISFRFALVNPRIVAEGIEANEFPTLSSGYRISGVPDTIVEGGNGKPVKTQRVLGAQPEHAFADALRQALGDAAVQAWASGAAAFGAEPDSTRPNGTAPIGSRPCSPPPGDRPPGASCRRHAVRTNVTGERHGRTSRSVRRGPSVATVAVMGSRRNAADVVTP